jgi:predicted enzyme related to lactoylglutathione lyase
MGPRSGYAPGTFSYVHLATTDSAAARAFYGELLGWTTEDLAGAPSPYAFFRLDGDIVAGVAQLPDAMADKLAWVSYVTVEDAAATAARARELGGAVIEEAFTVEDAGRMSLLADPHGAELVAWEPDVRIGAERVNDLGCLTMNELPSLDLDASRAYYEALFGWTTELVDTGPDGPPIVSVLNRGTLNATLSAAQPGEPSRWRPYFTVDSTASAIERVGELGGSVVMPPIPIQDGSIALVLDPQGALFGLFEGETDP